MFRPIAVVVLALFQVLNHLKPSRSRPSMHIAFVVPNLLSGGMERVVSTMANYWSSNGCDITILTFFEDAPFYDLSPKVKLVSLSKGGLSADLLRALFNNLRRAAFIRSAVRTMTPNVVISMGDRTNIVTLIATTGLKVPIIVSERVDPHRHSIGRFWDILRRLFYPRASCLVVQTERALHYFPAQVQRRACIIPNPVLMPSPTTVQSEMRPSNSKVGRMGSAGNAGVNKANKTLMGMGRLTKQKGFDLLLQAFARVALKHPVWNLEIWGEGALRPELESLIRELGLAEHVSLPGRTTQPNQKMRQADLFVLSSHFEGFPNALCEAMACGLPVISFDCPSGPREIIRHGIDGVLVPAADVNALAAVMDRLMSNENERFRLAEKAPEVLQRFGLEKVMEMWEDAVRKVL